MVAGVILKEQRKNMKNSFPLWLVILILLFYILVSTGVNLGFYYYIDSKALTIAAIATLVVGFFVTLFTLLLYFYEGGVQVRVKSMKIENRLDLDIVINNRTSSTLRIREIVVTGYYSVSGVDDDESETIVPSMSVEKETSSVISYPMQDSERIKIKRTLFRKRIPVKIQYELVGPGRTKRLTRYVK
jgi:hypothetical protein